MSSYLSGTKIPWYLILIFLMLSVGIGVAGYLYHQTQEELFKRQMEQELSTIADLKMDQILNWRKERKNIVTMPSRSPFVALGIKEFLKAPSHPIKKKRMLQFITSFKETYGFENIFLLDQEKRIVLSALEGKELDCPHFREIIDESFRKNEIILTDLHRVESEGRIHIGAVTPIEDPERKQPTPMALLVFEIDPHQFLYPLIQSWPIHSPTSETLLIRREGEELVYLNELRHQKNTALNLRRSIKEKHLPAAMALRGHEGVVEGTDYRGIPVIAAIRRISDSPWFLIAKIDKEEVYVPIYERARRMVILVGLLIIGSGIILGLFWSQQRSRFYKKQYEMERKHRVLLERFGSLMKYANDIILLLDQEFNIVEANERALSAYGYSLEEILHLNARDLRPPELRSDLEARFKQVDELNGAIYETLHRRKDGTLFPVEISTRRITLEGKKYYQSIIRDISERKRNEESLQKAYAELSAIYSNAPILMIIVDPDRKIRKANGAAARFAARTIGEMEGLRGGEALRCLHALEDPKGCGFGPSCETCKIREVVLETFKTGKPYSNIEANVPIMIEGKKEEKWFLLNTSPLQMGETNHVLICLQEITELKQTGGKLLETVEVLQTFINANPETSLLIDAEGNVLMVNDALVQRLGRRKEEIIGACLYDLFEQEVARNRKAYIDQVFQTGKPLRFEDSRSGRYYETFVYPIFDLQGKVTKVSILGIDITDRKLAEEKLRESEEKYRFLVEHAGEAIFVAQDGRLKFVNSKTMEILGYDREELTSRPFIEFIHPEDRAMVFERHTKRLQGEMLPTAYSFRILHRSGEIVWAELNTALIEWEGRPATLNFLTDITSRKKAEQEMASLQEQLRQSQKMEAIGRLAGGIAHDFNNLLTVIKGTCQLSLLDLREDDPLRASLKEIERSAERAADLTRQLLAFSRKQILEPQVLDLNALIKNLDKMLRRILGEDIQLVTFLDDHLGRIKIDPGQMEQVIINLAVNAKDAMPQGGKLTLETAHVELDEEYARKHVSVKPGSYVMLSVSDTGIGMTPEVKERIFEPFFTTKEMGKGTGLGLSTVYGIVKQSGGNIWVYSELGQGTTFKIYLPRVDEPLGEIRREVFRGTARGSETILVVEDDETVRKLAVKLLQMHGYKVLDASDARQALHLCRDYKEPIHLILTDVVMPEMSGRRLLEQMKEIHPEAKALYMSGYTDNVILHHGILEKGVEFLQKPFTLESLTRKVREVLDK